MFMNTQAAAHILQCVETMSCVTVTGSSGMGKTYTVRHVALQMARNGFGILHIKNPNDIINYYNPNKKTIFVMDNFCGTYTLNLNIFDKWKSLSDSIADILKDKKAKIIMSCRLQVFQDDLFKTLPLFTSCECNLMSKDLCLSPTERLSLAELYLKTDAYKIRRYVNLYAFPPLLCKLYRENPNFDVVEYFRYPFSVYETEINKLWTETAYGKYCGLALLVLFNNNLKEEWLTEETDKDIKKAIKNACEVCKLERGTSRLIIRDELESLTNTFIRKTTKFKIDYRSPVQHKITEGTIGLFFCTIHDKLFDFLVSYFGKLMLPTLIKNGDKRLLAETFLFEKQNEDIQLTVVGPQKYQLMYMQRITDDWSRGHVSDVFNNTNMKMQKYRHVFLNYLESLEQTFQNKLAKMCDLSYDITQSSSYAKFLEICSNTTPLMNCCSIGYINMVKWFCDHGSDVNHCNRDGVSPLHISCLKGHLRIITKLIESNADVNKSTKIGVTPLYLACSKGYTEVVGTLLDKKADYNQCTRDGKSPLFMACYRGYAEVVSQLLDKKADVGQNTLRENHPYLYLLEGICLDSNQTFKR